MRRIDLINSFCAYKGEYCHLGHTIICLMPQAVYVHMLAYCCEIKARDRKLICSGMNG